MTDTSQYFRCSCGSEVLNLDWLDADKRGLCVSVFDQRMGRSLWWKLKTCWRILREGSPWGDQVILQEDELKRLSSFFEAYGRRTRREREKVIRAKQEDLRRLRERVKAVNRQQKINDTLKKLIDDSNAKNKERRDEIRRRIKDSLGDAQAE